MNRVALVSWSLEQRGSWWDELLDPLEKGLSDLPRMAVQRVRWPADGFINLTANQVLIFAYPVHKWFPRELDAGWAEHLSKAGHLIGKTAYAITGTGGLGSEKTTVLLMNSLESEGMKVRDFAVVNNAQQVLMFLKKLQHMEKWDV